MTDRHSATAGALNSVIVRIGTDGKVVDVAVFDQHVRVRLQAVGTSADVYASGGVIFEANSCRDIVTGAYDFGVFNKQSLGVVVADWIVVARCNS